jgi:nicotinate-nucleotide adenylyltransferase
VRLGLFGGTFNPIHLGHLRAAVEVREAFDLEQILLIPAALPPHKDTTNMVSAQDRFEMVQLATQDVPSIGASDVELMHVGLSYTIHTLQEFHRRLQAQDALFFVVGIDAFLEITTWKSYRELFSLAQFVIMARPGARLKNLERFIKENISEKYEPGGTPGIFHHPKWLPIHQLSITHLDISSTVIRKRICEGRSVRFLVPPQVHAFIEEKRLYR